MGMIPTKNEKIKKKKSNRYNPIRWNISSFKLFSLLFYCFLFFGGTKMYKIDSDSYVEQYLRIDDSWIIELNKFDRKRDLEIKNEYWKYKEIL